MATQPNVPEAGLRNKRLNFIRESEFGVWGADPSMLLYSDSINSFAWTPTATLEARRGVGDADPTDHVRGPENHAFTINYDLVKALTATNDAAYDGLARDSDNLLPNSHTIVERADANGNVAAESTHEGATARPQRTYAVAQGAYIDTADVVGDPSAAQQVQPELNYSVQYMRVYKFDQPVSGDTLPTELVVKSTDAADTSTTVTIEDEGAANAEDVTLDGSDATTLVSTTQTYSDLDAVEVTADHAGDIEVAINTGTATAPTEGDTLAVIGGSNTYGGGYSDDGVPALGAGSRESVGSLGSPEQFIGDTISRGGSPIRHEIASATLSVANNIETQSRKAEYGMTLHPGNRDLSLSATMYGEDTSYDSLVQHLQNTQQDIVWTLDNSTVTIEQAALTTPGDRAAEEGSAIMTVENEFMAEGVTLA